MYVKIERDIALLDSILENWKEVIGEPYEGYRNHVYRVVNFCMLLHPCSEEDKQKLVIAGVFHDLGIWTQGDLDYIDASVELSWNYLDEMGLDQWKEEVGLMIDQHHKVTKYRDKAAKYPLVEVFREGDWVDVTRGKRSFGLEDDELEPIMDAFPNLGFHKYIMGLAKKELKRHPLKALPMMKW